MHSNRTFILRALIAMFLFAITQLASAQETYPSRPIRLVVPYPPGGSTDLLARVLVPRLTQFLNQQFVIDNRGGAGGNIGVDIVAKATPDGYTVGLFDTAFVVNPTLYVRLPFDALKDFRAVMVVAKGPSVLVVHPSINASNVKELIALVKAKPGGYSYASAGSGTAIHLAAEMLKVTAGINILHVPYKGAGPAITDVVGGQIHMMFAQPGTVIGHVNTGRMHALAITGEQRWSGMPQVPTFNELGMPAMDLSSVWQVMVPAKIAQARVDKLYGALQKTMAIQAVRDRLGELAYVPVAADPAQSATIVRNEIEKWGRAVKASGVKVE